MPKTITLDEFEEAVKRHTKKRKKRKHTEKVDIIWLTAEEIDLVVQLIENYGGTDNQYLAVDFASLDVP